MVAGQTRVLAKKDGSSINLMRVIINRRSVTVLISVPIINDNNFTEVRYYLHYDLDHIYSYLHLPSLLYLLSREVINLETHEVSIEREISREGRKV